MALNVNANGSNLLVKAILSYRSTAKGVESLKLAASRVGVDLYQALADAGLGKYKTASRGINPSFFGDKAPLLYPSQEEVVAAIFMRLEKINPAFAGEIAAAWQHAVSEVVIIHGRQEQTMDQA